MTQKPDGATRATGTLPIADHWGEGVTRRAIRLTPGAGRVDAALEDHRHAMICTVFHDGAVVTDVVADFRRYTLTHCPGSAAQLRELIGMPITIDAAAFFAGGRARRNCTHMLDLAWLAIRHCARGGGERLYEMAIPDAVTGPSTGDLRRDGETVLSWVVEDDTIVAPQAYAGRPLWRGFLRWACEESGLSDEKLEQCLVLHKGFFRRARAPVALRIKRSAR